MDDEALVKAMKAMGWNTNSIIPMANEENRAILTELEQLYHKKEELLDNNVQSSERADKLQQHTKNAEVTINHNLKLLEAYQAQVRSEAHLYKLTQRTHSKLKEDLRNINKDWNNYKKFVDNTEKEMTKRKQNIDNLTNCIKWAKNALTEWQKAMEEGNRGYQLIEMYYKDDQLRANQQNQTLQKTRKDIGTLHARLVDLYNEQKTLECNLECTAGLYRTAHAERRQMVETWKSAVSQMIQRENDIRNCEMQLIDLKTEAAIKSRDLKMMDKELNKMIATNKSVEASIEELNSETSQIREQIQILADMGILKANEVETLQKELQMLGHRVEEQRQENRRNSAMYTERLGQIKAINAVVEELTKKFKDKQNQSLSASERLQQLEQLMDEEEKMQKAINKETDRINALIYRAQKQVNTFKDDHAVLTVSNDGLKNNITAVTRNIGNVENELKRQTELHYDLAFKILRLERDIITIQGGIADPETEQSNRLYFQDLEAQHAKMVKTLQGTQQQNKKLDDDMRKLTVIYNNDHLDLEEVSFKIKEAQVYCEGGVKRMREVTQHNQELIVELSLLKMRAREFESDINECDEGTYNLVKHRMHLNRTISDRMVELKSQMDLLQLKRKHLNEELSTLRADIGERTKHIEAVKARFELTSKLLGVNADGTVVTATQLRVETAQEKQMLLDEGNILNERVLKAEEDIKALENTLALLNNVNDNFRKKMVSPHDTEQSQKEFQTLQNNYCTALSELKELRLKFNKLQQNIDVALKDKESLENKLAAAANKKIENEEFLKKVQKDLFDQEVKLQRASRDLKQAVKAVKQRPISNEFMELFERDLDLKELEKRNMNVLNQLGEIVETDFEIGPKIARNLMSRGMKLPHTLQKSHSSISWRSSDLSGLDSVSLSSSAEVPSSSRSAISEETKLKLSVVSLDFPEKKQNL